MLRLLPVLAIYRVGIAPQAAYCSCGGAFVSSEMTCIVSGGALNSTHSPRVIDRAGVRPVGRGPSPRSRTFTFNQTAIRSPGLPFDGLHSLPPTSM